METTEDSGLIAVDSPAWEELIQKIVSNFTVGQAITHSFLKKEMGIKYILYSDYETQEDFEKALEIKQFTYMGLIDKLRWDILEKEQFYLQNVRGEGYRLMPPADQVNFAYEMAIKDIKKAFSTSELIMKNVRKSMITPHIRKENADTLAKFSMYKQMVLGMFRKKN